MLSSRDAELVQILDHALADATLRGGSFLACRPGCTPCCHGVFRISQLDAERLRTALATLRVDAPERAFAIMARVRAAVAALAPHFPGDAKTGLLAPESSVENTTAASLESLLGALYEKDEKIATLIQNSAEEDDEAWDTFADLPEANQACPVLDPVTGRCELYSGRPLTCRVFGPPVQNEDGIGMCELCYVGASEQQILTGEMPLAHLALEAALDREMAEAGHTGETIIAWALLGGEAV